MKKLIALLLLMCVLSLSFVACDKNGDENPTTSDDPSTEEISSNGGGSGASKPDTSCDEAITLINSGKYLDAYKLLIRMQDNAEAEKLLESFYFLTKTVDAYVNGELQSSDTMVFDENNLPSERAFALWECTFHCDYDAQGRPSRLIYSEYEDGELDYYEQCDYTYDDNNRLIKEVCVDSYDDLSQILYTYDNRGNLVQKETEYSTGSSVEVYTYNDKNLLVKYVSTSVEDSEEWVLETDYTYDADGNLTLETSTEFDGSTYGREYTYENGRLIKERYFDSDGEAHEIQSSYNAQGQLVQRTFTSSYMSLVQTYTYDANGNLIKVVEAADYMFDTETTTTVYEYRADKTLLKETVTYEGGTVSTTWYDEYGNETRSQSEYDDGDTEVIEMTYQLVYMPFDLPWLLEEMIFDWY